MSPTTNVASAAFADANSDGCARAGAGFGSPGADGPRTLAGAPAPGPCCTVGQPTTVVSAGVAFTGGAPLYDVGYQVSVPSTVQSCGIPDIGESCTLGANGCLGAAPLTWPRTRITHYLVFFPSKAGPFFWVSS